MRSLLLCLGLVCAIAGASPPALDLAEFRLRIASDRSAGLAEGRAALEAGVFADDPVSRRTLLWFMGGAAVGSADDEALEQIRSELLAMAEAHGDIAAHSFAGFLRGARLLDLGELGEGLVEVLTAANPLADSDDPSIQRIAAGELCRSYSATDRLDQALVHCRRHTERVSQSGDAAALARAEYLEASVLSYLGEHEEAILRWRSARQRFSEHGLQALADRTAGSLASDQLALGDFEAALESASIALQAAEAGGSVVSIGIAGGYVASALSGLGRDAEAIAVAQRSLEAIRDLAHPSVESSLLRALERALLASEGEASPALREVRSRIEALTVSKPPSPEQVDAIEALEERVRQRSLDLRIRELEQEAEIKALALQAAQLEAERNEAALQGQRRVTWMAVVASAALLAALLTLGLLLRAQRRLAASLHAQAYRDSLTGLPNRRAFLEEATALLSDGPRPGPHTLLLVDIDHFKSINDRGGHPFGDEVLIATAQCLRQHAPAAASVARLGGEEFVVLCPQLAVEAAMTAAETLRQAVADQRFRLDGGALTTSVSIGVAGFDSRRHANVGGWLKAADQALYRAKAEGRDRVVAALNP